MLNQKVSHILNYIIIYSGNNNNKPIETDLKGLSKVGLFFVEIVEKKLAIVGQNSIIQMCLYL